MGKMLLIFILLYVITLLIPKLAKKIDTLSQNNKKKRQEEDQRLYSVRSAFEPRPDDEKPDKTFFPELKKNQKNDNENNGNEDL